MTAVGWDPDGWDGEHCDGPCPHTTPRIRPPRSPGLLARIRRALRPARGAVTVEIYFVRTDPVQEVAAEPATLDLLRDILQEKAVESRATPEPLTAAQATGWPLVYDDTIRPGTVHCRPTPGAGPPPSLTRIRRALRRSRERTTPKVDGSE